MINRIGKIIIILGIIHSIFGFIFFRNIFPELVREMLFNSIKYQLDRQTAFWFIYFGFATLIIGGLIDWIEHKNLELPSFLKWSFLAITLLGCFIMPISGIWLFFIPTICLFLRRNNKLAIKSS